MPVLLNYELPAYSQLKHEGVWVVASNSKPPSSNVNFPPLKIGVINLMPQKSPTETQIARVMGRSPIHVDLKFLVPDTYAAKNTPRDYLAKFYQRWSEVANEKFDGIIVTGAPIEHLPFEKVSYWSELQNFFRHVEETRTPLYALCWGAMAALYHFHQVPKYITPRKEFGVFPHQNLCPTHLLMQGLPDVVHVPVSRHTKWKLQDVQRTDLQVLLDSHETGPCAIWDEQRCHLHMINHMEYDVGTLHGEYTRDSLKGTPTGEPIHLPQYYYPDDDPAKPPRHVWKAEGQVFYNNWLAAILRHRSHLAA